MAAPLSAQRAGELVLALLADDEDQTRADLLLELLRGLVGSTGDARRDALADEVMRLVFVRTKACEQAFKEYMGEDGGPGGGGHSGAIKDEGDIG